MLALQAVTPNVLSRELGIALADARKIVSAVHRGAWTDGVAQPQGREASEAAGAPLPKKPRAICAGVRRTVLEAVRARSVVPALAIRAVRRSGLDPFVKFALATIDGHVIEAVRIPLERPGRFTACVSSQAGCALACAFCATGRLGLARNLLAWEIVEQVRAIRATLGAEQRVHGVVFQGMGEPLANVERVIDAVRVMADPCALAIDARAITVCTSGIPSAIVRLAREVPKVRLGVSISSARPEVRRRLMPIDHAHPLGEVIEATEHHARVTGLAPMWAITPLAGVNDTDEDARALAELARGFETRTGIRPRISLVPYNAIDDAGRDPFARGDVAAFVQRLVAAGVRPHVRYSGGSDVAAACGQLVGLAQRAG